MLWRLLIFYWAKMRIGFIDSGLWEYGSVRSDTSNVYKLLMQQIALMRDFQATVSSLGKPRQSWARISTNQWRRPDRYSLGYISSLSTDISMDEFYDLQPNGEYPPRIASKGHVNFEHNRQQCCRLFEEGDKYFVMGEFSLALQQFREAACVTKRIAHISGYTNSVIRVQNALWDCWTELSNRVEAQSEDDILSRFLGIQLAPRVTPRPVG